MNNLEYGLSLSKSDQLDFYGHGSPTIAMGVLRDFADWLVSEHIEPIVLTAEERKAAELAVAIGLPWIKRTNSFVFVTNICDQSLSHKSICVESAPALECLCLLKIKQDAEPIDLRELLKSQKLEPERAVTLCRNCKHRYKMVNRPPCNACHGYSHFEAQDNG